MIKSNRTLEQKQKIRDYLTYKGYPTLESFGEAVGMEKQHIWVRVEGKCNPDITTMFRWADALHCNLITVISLFYPNEHKEYKQKREK